ncbi:chaperonin [Metarhizium robertsii ARSEF 23]|uniref:Chaperonin n=1 Tax=Metarhizium robertsii (strain ARSEF 23 / ATCC MYA-3075) TaxID=655844 RepID=A0A0B2XHE9_METRA|nr:chaperonin [Metarhizium robertsii ARSEF 23]KHO10982.1 chaperonin [Metarhizium robertsii ARSEF 23]
MKLQSIIKRVELHHVSSWMNDDVRPVESERRTWSFRTFHNFWLLINCNLSTFLTGSALIPLGLTWWQAIITIVIGNMLATGALLLSSLAGSYYHINFPVFSRAVWVWLAVFTSPLIICRPFPYDA